MRLVRAFTAGLRITIDCQLKRMRLICKSDSFLNTFVSTHVLTDLLERDLQGAVPVALAEHRREAPPASDPASPEGAAVSGSEERLAR